MNDYDARSGRRRPRGATADQAGAAGPRGRVGRLPHDQREIVLLREIEDMSYSEIGAVLGINEGTVKSRLARAREALDRLSTADERMKIQQPDCPRTA